MTLWLLKRTDRVGYDEYAGFVIRASSEREAREIAWSAASDEPRDVWLNDAVAARPIDADGKDEIILGDFNAG